MGEIAKLGSLEASTSDIVRMFNNVLLQLDDVRQELAEAGDYESLAHGLKNLIDFRNNLIAVIQMIEKNLYDLLPEKKQVIDGVGMVEKRRSSTKKWDSEKLLNDIVRRGLDNGTGEITPTDIFNLVDTLKRVLPITASLGWRVTELRKIVDPDFYCETSWGRPTIQVTSQDNK